MLLHGARSTCQGTKTPRHHFGPAERAHIKRTGKTGGNSRGTAPPRPFECQTAKPHVRIFAPLSMPKSSARERERTVCSPTPYPSHMPTDHPRQHFDPAKRAQTERMGERAQIKREKETELTDCSRAPVRNAASQTPRQRFCPERARNKTKGQTQPQPGEGAGSHQLFPRASMQHAEEHTTMSVMGRRDQLAESARGQTTTTAWFYHAGGEHAQNKEYGPRELTQPHCSPEPIRIANRPSAASATCPLSACPNQAHGKGNSRSAPPRPFQCQTAKPHVRILASLGVPKPNAWASAPKSSAREGELTFCSRAPHPSNMPTDPQVSISAPLRAPKSSARERELTSCSPAPHPSHMPTDSPT